MVGRKTRGRKSSREVEARAEASDGDHPPKRHNRKEQRGTQETGVQRSENRERVWERATARPQEAYGQTHLR